MPATKPHTPDMAASAETEHAPAASMRIRLHARAQPRRADRRARALAAALAAGSPAGACRPRSWPAGMRALGLCTVGDLLEHLPSDSREARTVAALRAGEQATVAVQVRAITARPVRRRGMRPLVEATVFDATATMRATFFNQPWLVERYPPGTRLLLHGKADARGGFSVSHHAPGADVGAEPSAIARAGAQEMAPTATRSPTTRPPRAISSTQILTLVRARQAARWRRPRGAARRRPVSASGSRTARARSRRCTSRAYRRTTRRGAGGWPSRSCC